MDRAAEGQDPHRCNKIKDICISWTGTIASIKGGSHDEGLPRACVLGLPQRTSLILRMGDQLFSRTCNSLIRRER